MVDRSRCQAAGECMHLAPATFHMDPAIVAAVFEPPGDPDEVVLEAAGSCPNGAIRVYRDGVELDPFAAPERTGNA
jgi:ferredoxin